MPHLPDFAESEQDSSHTKQATVTLPRGMGINPSPPPANGLQTCTDAQFGKGTRNPVTCPPQSIVGRAKIDSPPLVDQANPQPEEVLEGNVYVGQQLSRDPTSGNEYRIFIDANSDRYGIDVRLVGNVRADPQTGQLTTTIADSPAGPLHLVRPDLQRRRHGPVLSSPPTCGPNQTTADDDALVGQPPGAPRTTASR